MINNAGYATESILILFGELGVIFAMGPILISLFVIHKSKFRVPKDNRNIYVQNSKCSVCLLIA